MQGKTTSIPNVSFSSANKAIPSSWVPEYPLPQDINEYSPDAQRWVRNLWGAAVMSARIMGQEDAIERTPPTGVLGMA